MRSDEVLDWVSGFEKGCVKLVQMVTLRAGLGTAWLQAIAYLLES